jgi:low affinity Fe/Cu permease
MPVDVAVLRRRQPVLAWIPHGRHPDHRDVADRTEPGDSFNRIADRVTTALGSLPALVGSVLLVVVWALTGPLFHFSDTWQLFINTTTTVVTFWMVFVIQNTANRQSKATQLKLDELIRAVSNARNEFIALDRASDAQLVEHEKEFIQLADSTGGGVAAVRQRTTRGPTRASPRRPSSTDGQSRTKARSRRRRTQEGEAG